MNNVYVSVDEGRGGGMGEDRFEPEKAVWREGHFIYTCKDEEEFAGEKWEGEWKYCEHG